MLERLSDAGGAGVSFTTGGAAGLVEDGDVITVSPIGAGAGAVEAVDRKGIGWASTGRGAGIGAEVTTVGRVGGACEGRAGRNAGGTGNGGRAGWTGREGRG